MLPNPNQKRPSGVTRLLAKLIRELLDREAFETFGDLNEALKCRCAALHIRWTNELLDEALALVGSNRRLVTRRQPAPESTLDPLPLSHADALAVLARITERFW
jgi:hypothetical protein